MIYCIQSKSYQLKPSTLNQKSDYIRGLFKGSYSRPRKFKWRPSGCYVPKTLLYRLIKRSFLWLDCHLICRLVGLLSLTWSFRLTEYGFVLFLLGIIVSTRIRIVLPLSYSPIAWLLEPGRHAWWSAPRRWTNTRRCKAR